MEENLYSKLPKLKVELSLSTLVGGVLIIIFAFIIPVALIQNSKNYVPPKTETVDVVSGPLVAGASTSREATRINLPIINQEVLLEGQSGVLILLGLILFGVSIFIILFLIADSLKKKPKIH